MWAYARMKGWKALKNIDFDFFDAHDLKPLTNSARSETYIKQRLAERMKNAKQVIVIVGDKTKNLYRFVRWEIEQAQRQNLPIIVANLNKVRNLDENLCPKILKTADAVHVSFRLRILKFALDNFPPYYHKEAHKSVKTNYYYKDSVYKDLGLND